MTKYRRVVFSLIGTMLLISVLSAQSTFRIHVFDSIDLTIVDDVFKESLEKKDSLAFIASLQSEIIRLWSDGYLTAAIDTVYNSDSIINAGVYVGPKYRFGDIRISSSHMAMVSAAGLKNVRWQDKMISQSMIGEYTENLLLHLENNGYPFARVGLDSVLIDNGVLTGSLNLDKKRFVPFDSLDIHGTVDIRRSFIDRYLNIKANDPYSRKKINDIKKRINDLAYMELDSTPLIRFANDVAEVSMVLKPRKASRFDFLIGVLPSSDNGERTFNITGEFTAEMYNRLGHGEYIYANFQRIDPIQQLELRFKYPYLFDLPFGTDVKGGIYFNEEFRETIFNAGLLYQFDGNATLKASWNNKSSRLITIDTAAIISGEMLPTKLDLTYNGGGIEFATNNLDYRFNPSRGWHIRFGGSVGIKRIIKNNSIQSLSTETLDFDTAYDTLKLNTFQTEINVSSALYIPAFRVATLKLGIEGGLQYNEEQLYDNELYRIGGNKLLRGFDEQSILTGAYLVSTAEFRLLLDRNSYLSFPFIDYGITRISSDAEDIWDTAISVGMGINFATSAGIFNVSFAAGRRLDNPIDLGNTKLHFGYVSLF